MRKLFMAAAALTIAIAAAPAYVGSSEAASAKRVAAANPDWGPGSQYCKLASFQRNAPSWNEHYGCRQTSQRRPVAQAAEPRPTRVAAASAERGPGSQYCKLASFQRNAPSWNEHYGCRQTSRQARTQAPAPVRVAAADTGAEWGPGSQYCKLAGFQRNAPSWNEAYGCLRR